MLLPYCLVNVHIRFKVQLSLHAQIHDNMAYSASCWSFGEQQEPKDTNPFWNQRTPSLFFLAKISPTFCFFFFFFALISVLSMSFCDNVCSACSIYSVRQPSTAFARQNSKEWLLPHRPETTPQRSVTAASAPLRSACHCINPPPSPIVAAVGGGGPILARR